MRDIMQTIVTTLARPRVEAAAAGLHGLEIAVGFDNVPALRRVPIGSGGRGGKAQRSGGRGGKGARSSGSPRGRLPGFAGGASMGNSAVAWRIEPVPGLSLPKLAAIHEFGAPRANVPERSYMRRALREHRSLLRRHAVRVLQAVAAGRRTKPLTDAMAAALKKAVQDTIRSTVSPPMSPRHRARRIAMGDPNPQLLYDTHQLHDGVIVTVGKGRSL